MRLVPRSMWDPLARIVSQAITALVNIAVTAAAAHSLTLDRFGLFALGWGILQSAIFYVRVVLVPLVILDERKPRLLPLVLASFSLSGPVGLAVAVIGIWLTDDVPVCLLLGLAVIAILAFEVARGALVGFLEASGRHRALAVDASYALVALAIAGAVSLGPWRPIVCVLCALPIASAVSVLVGMRIRHEAPTEGALSLLDWARKARHGLGFGVAEWAAFALSSQIALAVLAVVASPALVGGLRGGQALLFPMLLIGSSVPTIVAPMLADSRAQGSVPRSVWTPPLVLFSAVVGIWIALTVVNPYNWVRLLLDDASEPALRAFPLLAVGALFGIAASVVSVYLRSLGMVRRIAVARWANVASEPLLVVLGGFAGLIGAAAGMAIAPALGLLMLLGMLRRPQVVPPVAQVEQKA